MTSIGLISDVHATPRPVAEALALFADAGVDQVFCAGDIAGYGDRLEETVTLLEKHGCRSIRGNHELRYLKEIADEPATPAADFLRQLPVSLDCTLEGVHLHIAHAHPPGACLGGIRLLDMDGEIQPEQAALWAERLEAFDYDVLVVGHTHQVFAERLGKMLVINPGSSAFNHSCAILHLPDLEVEFHALSGRRPIHSWHWGSR